MKITIWWWEDSFQTIILTFLKYFRTRTTKLRLIQEVDDLNLKCSCHQSDFLVLHRHAESCQWDLSFSLCVYLNASAVLDTGMAVEHVSALEIQIWIQLICQLLTWCYSCFVLHEVCAAHCLGLFVWRIVHLPMSMAGSCMHVHEMF